jgi:DNA-binding response OmpR family regulator
LNGADGDNPALHAFSRWRFDAGTGDLSDGMTTTRLEPQVAKLLDYFLTHQDTLVSRDELMAAVWDNRIVSDDAINRCISILRQTLSPDDRTCLSSKRSCGGGSSATSRHPCRGQAGAGSRTGARAGRTTATRP